MSSSHAHATVAMAISATLHCLTGCAIGEIAGLIIGSAAGLGNLSTTLISIALAFFFGYTLSALALLDAGAGLGTALSVVLAADTLSIATMEVVDNGVVALFPGAMAAGLADPVFWISMALSLAVAFAAALPVNRYLLARGKGHALTHGYHAGTAHRLPFPLPATNILAVALAMFMLGGLLVAVAG